jgi:opacity protein-like surface antigen
MKHHLLVWVAAAALAASQGAAAQMMANSGGGYGDWEFRIGPVFQESKNIGFNGGTSAKIDSTTGVKFGAGYYVTDHLIIGGNFSWGQSSFSGSVASGTPGVSAQFENGHVDFSTLIFDAQYTFLNGPIKPFGKVGLGWNWINTNIASGPPQYGCWWDPWWGYVCSGWQPTHGASSFTYQVGAGVQVNFTRTFAVDLDYQYTWIDLNNTTSTPGFGAVELLFVWRFPAYH